jgi:hypothetical protein
MTLLGWLFMLTSVVGVWVLTIWCFKQVLSAPDEVPEEAKHFHSA